MREMAFGVIVILLLLLAYGLLVRNCPCLRIRLVQIYNPTMKGMQLYPVCEEWGACR